MAAEKIPGWIHALEFNMNTRIDSLESNMNTRMYRFEAINTRLDSLDKRIPV